MLTAVLVFVPLTLLLIYVEQRLYAAAQSSALQRWLAGHLYLPLLRAVALLVFIFMAYPQLFGLANGPSLRVLLATGSHRTDQLINILLLVALLLPLLPFVNRIAGVTLALQGICATALIASWMALETALAIRLLPDAGLFLRMTAVLVTARLVADLLAKELVVNSDSREIAIEAARMAAQIPVIVIYARFLGAQLPA